MSKDSVYSVDYWKQAYQTSNVTIKPSSFARFCVDYLDGQRGKLLDVCCGNGRDSVYFERMKFNVRSFDISQIGNHLSNYKELNLMDKIPNFGYDEKFDHVYCRFVLHSVPEELEDYILDSAFNILPKGGYLFIEVRSDKGDISTGINNHYRRLINMNKLKSKLSNNFKFRIVYEMEAGDLSVYNGENPVLIRIIAKRKGVLNPDDCRDMLLYTKQVLDANKIPFFLVFGTLLGAYREQRFIPHDTDVDIGLFRSDRGKVIKLVHRGVFSKFGMQFRTNHFIAFNSFDYKNENIDFFFFMKKRTDYDFKCMCFTIEPKYFHKGLQPIEFLGTTFSTVQNIEEYLEDRYGLDWRVPIVNKHAAR